MRMSEIQKRHRVLLLATGLAFAALVLVGIAGNREWIPRSVAGPVIIVLSAIFAVSAIGARIAGNIRLVGSHDLKKALAISSVGLLTAALIILGILALHPGR